MDVSGKRDRLERIVGELGGAVVAFSGGVDSSLLLATCRDVLGPATLAVTSRSPVHPAREVQRACGIAAELGVEHLLVDSREMEDPDFVKNPPDRCYHCKLELFGVLWEVARERGIPHVVEGSNAGDPAGHRPGIAAARELGVRAPLLEAGLRKDEIRTLARAAGLSCWDRPASGCLATRIPHGDPVVPEVLESVDRAEQALAGMGYAGTRVRAHGAVARLELAEADIDRCLDRRERERVVEAVRGAGFGYVALDLEGYRCGSLDAVIED
jgi:uncharacterized protein